MEAMGGLLSCMMRHLNIFVEKQFPKSHDNHLYHESGIRSFFIYLTMIPFKMKDYFFTE